MRKYLYVITKSIATCLLCFFFFPSKSQNNTSEKPLTFARQWRFSLTTAVYDNLTIANQGTRHLYSLPTLSGEFTVSYLQHVGNNFNVSVGVGIGVTPHNIRFRFVAPENSPFHFDNGEPFDLQLFHNDYDGSYFQVPLSLHKVFHGARKKAYSLELGTKLNLQNIDPSTLPYRWDYSSEYELDRNNVTLFSSFQQTNKGIAAMSYFLKIGLLHPTIKQHSLEYRLVFNWSPRVIRKGEYQFYNLPYTSQGTTRQNINFIGFEITYGLTTLRRLAD